MSVNQVDKQTGNTSLVAGGTLYADAPIGAIQAFGGTSAPAGWLLCQGQAISRTTYAALFAVIGTAFGAGDGSTTFNVPDLREATTKGAGETGQTVGAHVKSGGLAVGEFIDDRLQSHNHNYYNSYYEGPYYAKSEGILSYYNAGQAANTFNETGRTGDTTEVKAVGVNYIIKAQQVALPLDIVNQVETVAGNSAETYIEQKLKGVLEYTLTVSGEWRNYTTNHMVIRFVDEASNVDLRISFADIVQGSSVTYNTIGKTSDGNRNINIYRGAIGSNIVYISIEGTSTDHIECYGCDF